MLFILLVFCVMRFVLFFLGGGLCCSSCKFSVLCFWGSMLPILLLFCVVCYFCVFLGGLICSSY
jgi:hypothetical protein